MAKGGERINMLEGHAGILRRGGAGPVTDSAWLQTSLPSEGELKAVSRLLLSREPFGDSKACVCVCVCVCVLCVLCGRWVLKATKSTVLPAAKIPFLWTVYGDKVIGSFHRKEHFFFFYPGRTKISEQLSFRFSAAGM